MGILVAVAILAFVAGALLTHRIYQHRKALHVDAVRDFCHLTGEAVRMMGDSSGACTIIKQGTSDDHRAHVKDWMENVKKAEERYTDVIGQTPKQSKPGKGAHLKGLG